jgi:uncharacterized protein (TIGR02598 family)
MKTKGLSQSKAFSLIEVVLALAIMSFCLIVLLGLLPLSLATIKNASEETSGINVASMVVSDLKSTPSTNSASSTYGLTLPTATAMASQAQVIYLDQAGGKLANATSAGARYKVTVTLSPPSAQNTIAGLAQLSWPAQAVNNSPAVEVFFALNRS